MEKQYISDVIGTEYEKWHGHRRDFDETPDTPFIEGDYVFIEAAMGTGKTSFIFNNLSKYATERDERILYLCNRIPLKEDASSYKAKSEFKNIDIMTYQTLENIVEQKNRSLINPETECENRISKDTFARLGQYKYIVADECHYFLEDSTFNGKTHYSFSFLTEKSPQIRILISATPGILKKVFFRQYKRSGFIYSLEKDMSYVNLQFYRDDRSNGMDYPRKVIEDVLLTNSDEKIVYFVDSKKRMAHLLSESSLIKENSTCLFAGDDEPDRELVKDANCIERVSDDYSSFQARVLLTTTVISNGVSLKDRNIKWIICDIENPFTAVQCIGRKRKIDEEDNCNILVRYYLEPEFGYKLNKALAQVRLTEKFLLSPEDYANEIGSFAEPTSECLYTDWHHGGKVNVNWPKYLKYAQDEYVYSRIIRYNKSSGDGAYGYCKCFMEISGITNCKSIKDYFMTEEILDSQQDELLAELTDIISENLGEKIYMKAELGKKINRIKKDFNKLQRKKKRAAFTVDMLYEKACSRLGADISYSINKKKRTYVVFLKSSFAE